MALLSLMLQILAQDLERCAQSYLETLHRGTVTAIQGERSPATAQHCRSEFQAGLAYLLEFLLNFHFFEIKHGRVCLKKKKQNLKSFYGESFAPPAGWDEKAEISTDLCYDLVM